MSLFIKVLFKMTSEDISEKQYNLLKLPLIVINTILIVYMVTLIVLSTFLLEEHCLIMDSVDDFQDSLNRNESKHRYSTLTIRVYCRKVFLFLFSLILFIVRKQWLKLARRMISAI